MRSTSRLHAHRQQLFIAQLGFPAAASAASRAAS
jgi:hypothetical protein